MAGIRDFEAFGFPSSLPPEVQQVLESTRQPVMAPPAAAAPQAATPTDMSAGGLYALYQQPNAARSRASELASMAFRPKGAGQIDLAAPVLAYMAGKEMKAAKEADTVRDKEIADWKTRYAKSEQVRADEAQMAREKQKFAQFLPSLQAGYIQKYKEAVSANKDPQKELAPWAADEVNKWAKANNITNMGYFKALNMWGDGQATFLVSNDGKTFVNGKVDNGNIVIDDGRGNWKPADGFMPVKNFNEMQDAKYNIARAEAAGKKTGGSLRDWDLTAINSQLNSLRSMVATTGEPLSAADQVQYDALTEEMNRRLFKPGQAPTNPQPTSWTPGQNPPPGAFKKAQDAQGPRIPQRQPLSAQPGFAPAPQASTSTFNAADASGLIPRKTADGRIALYDQNKNFVRYQ